MQVPGWGAHPTEVGHIWLMPQTNTTPEFMKAAMLEVHFPAIRAQCPLDCKQEHKVLSADGNIAQAQVLTTDKDVRQEATNMKLNTLKVHRGLSFLFNANDTWKTGHKKIKAQLRSGSIAEFTDPRVLRAAEAEYKRERKRIKEKHPKCNLPKEMPPPFGGYDHKLAAML